MSQTMGVAFEDDLPLAYVRMSASVLPAERLRLEQADIELLRSMTILDEGNAERSGDEVRDNELQRLEMKVNLLLDMMARLLSFQAELPSARRVRMTAAGIEFGGATDLTVGDEVRVDVFLSAKLPRALVLLGRVASIDQESQARIISLDGASQAMQDAWDKFIFRQHRRMVAIQRRAVSSSSK